MVLADPIKIHQVVMNLCTNAYHAMRKTGGQLTVSLEKRVVSKGELSVGKTMIPGEYLRLEVRDTGYGMDEKSLGRIFEP